MVDGRVAPVRVVRVLVRVRDMRGLQAGGPPDLDDERLELRLQGGGGGALGSGPFLPSAGPFGGGGATARRASPRAFHRPYASSLDIVSPSWSGGGNNSSNPVGGPSQSHSSSLAEPRLENGELRRLQEKRARAQRILEREREQDRIDRDKNQENLIPDSKKAPQVRREERQERRNKFAAGEEGREELER